MKIHNMFAITGAMALLLVSAPSFAAKVTTLTCPDCKMPMPTKKMKGFTAPVIIKGKEYYCCTACPAGKAAIAYGAKHHGMPMVISK